MSDERPLLDANEYLADCFRLARRIWDDGYRPDVLVALWRGGTPPGIAIQEYLRWKGRDPYHTSIRTQSLEGIRDGGGFDIKGLEHVIDEVESEDRLLIVDDLCGTGRTIHEVIEHLRTRARKNTPEIRVATVYSVTSLRRYPVGPHYWLREIDARPIFPHQITELSRERLTREDPELADAIWGPVPAAERSDGH